MRYLRTFLFFALLAGITAGCVDGTGGPPNSSSGSTTTTTTTTGQNVVAVTVDAGPANNDVNVPFISVTICAPGSTTNCQTIDHISVDTGSSGLRIIASVLSPTLALTQQIDGSGNPYAECTQFADGYVWGSVRLADLKIAGEKASSLPIQVIGDAAFPNVPSDCSNTGPAENSVPAFGANGIIGVGTFQADCGSICATTLASGAYYICPATGCVNTMIPLGTQVQNPIGLFATDNNGVVLQMSSVPANGSSTASGSLIFGIGTQTNNALASVTVYDVDPTTGYLVAQINSTRYPHSYVDSGSSAYFLPASLATPCTSQLSSGYFCPAATLNLSATVTGTNNAVGVVSFNVANADTLFNAAPSFTAFNDLAAINSDGFSIDFGLPFFYGRTVFTAIENRPAPGGGGPYVAF